MRRTRLRVFVPLVLAIFAALPAFGNTITVTNTGDSGPGSLRDAIAAASPGDTINFSLTYPATIALGSTLNIGTSLTISGPGASNLAISGNNTVGVVDVNPGVTVSISGVTIENGNSFFGGGIYNDNGTLTLTDSTVSGNSTTYYGGGIYNYSGTLTLTNSTVSGNSSYDGGGIFNFYNGTLTLTNSTVSGNSSTYYGGGILNYFATLALTNSTVSGNSTQYGGGIFNYYATLALTNSTVSGNSATSSGGGIYNFYYGTLTLTNSTVSGNSGTSSGGGILNDYATLTLKNTVVASSSGGNCSSPSGVFTSDGYNLSDDTSCSGFLTSVTDQNNISAGLDSQGLQDNGGPTKTIALLSTSPAADAIPVADCTLPDGSTPVAADQRGVTRPQGAACEIGAFELVESATFSSFGAKLDIKPGSTSTIALKHPSFDLNSKFSLGTSSNGINPLTEVVELQVGTYQTTIPAGSFHQLPNGAKKGSYVFSGAIGGVSLSIQIVPLGGNSYQFKATGSPVDLTTITNPVTVTLTIGNDTGTAPVYADF